MKKIFNTTPHPIRMQSPDGTVYEVPPCGTLINAKVVETFAGLHAPGVELVKTRFVADEASEAALAALETARAAGDVIVGSIIAAQAFPGRVYGLIPVPGFERVPPAEKRMRDDKFTVFGGE